MAEDQQAVTPAFQKLAEALTAEYGWAVSPVNDAIIQAAVAAKAQRLGIGPDDYAQLVTANQSELLALVEETAVGATGFFQTPEQFAYLREQIAPQLLATNTPERPPHWWSAATATGEEAYSLAILLEQLAPQPAQKHAEIFATDVRNRALLTASAAQYPLASVTDLDAGTRAEFFKETGADKVMVAQRARRLVSFRRVNLNERLFWRGVPQKFDLIVCANLLGMLSGMAARALVSNLNYALREGGVLMIAPHETSLMHSTKFKPLNGPAGFFIKG